MNEYLKEFEERSRKGDEVYNFYVNAYPVLNKYILLPLEQKAFETFVKVDPSDMTQVIETQKMVQIINAIRTMIQTVIEEGRLAKQTLKTLPTEDV